MNKLDLYAVESSEDNPLSNMFGDISERAQMIADHKHWLQTIRHEQPNPAVSFRVCVYIRGFNQTKYEDYLEHHKKQYLDTLALCPNWILVDFHIDKGFSAPSMRSAPEWSRLLNDAMEGKVDLIITPKVSNVSRSPEEITFCSKINKLYAKENALFAGIEESFEQETTEPSEDDSAEEPVPAMDQQEMMDYFELLSPLSSVSQGKHAI